MVKDKIRWSGYQVYELVGETVQPVIASTPVLQIEETDEKGKKKIVKYTFPRDKDNRPCFSPRWFAGLLDNCATRDKWQLASQLRKNGVKISLSTEEINDAFEEQRLAGSHIRKFDFVECEVIGEATPIFKRNSHSFIDKYGKRTANIFDAETFPKGTRFKVHIVMLPQFYKHVLTLLEIGGWTNGVGESRQKGNYGRYTVISFKKA